jgi:phosphoribosylglycinamide formyltransferase-1
VRRLVVLISGRGSNMEAIARAGLPAQIALVISSHPDAPGLERARRLGLPTRVLDYREYGSRDDFDAALGDAVAAAEPDLVALAGFMRILTPAFVARFEGRMLNIHPSLLPAFPGLRTHDRALEEGVRVHGCTVHFVTSDLDHGPIVIQAAVPVRDGDTAEMLADRVLAEEHRIYAQAIRWFLSGRVRLDSGRLVSRDMPPASGTALHCPGLEA